MTPLLSTLKRSCAAEWVAYIDHPFVRALGEGTLPEAAFRRYLGQDYLFLIHFARAYGLAAFKGETIEDIRQAALGLDAMINVEMGLHVSFSAGWGLTEAGMAALPEADATIAYTRFVLERGLAGDLLDLHVALAPCIVGYAEIGQALAARHAATLAANPYRAWVEMYASADYQSVAEAETAYLDTLMAQRGGPGRLDGLVATFRQATRLEAAFWDMGLAV